VVNASGTVTERTGFKTQFVNVIYQKLPVHSPGDGYPTCFRAGEGGGGEEEHWHPTTYTVADTN